MNHWTRIAAVLLLPLALVVSGCEDTPVPPANAPVRRPPPKRAGAAAGDAAEADKATEGEGEGEGEEAEAEYVYTPIGLRDPFRSPFRVVATPPPPVVDDNRTKVPLTQLQEWGLEQLKLQATITGTSDPVAMVVDPDGEGHVARRGDLIGKNWGKISAILRDCIVVTEQIRTSDGAIQRVRSRKCLPLTQKEEELAEEIGK